VSSGKLSQEDGFRAKEVFIEFAVFYLQKPRGLSSFHQMLKPRFYPEAKDLEKTTKLPAVRFKLTTVKKYPLPPREVMVELGKGISPELAERAHRDVTMVTVFQGRAPVEKAARMVKHIKGYALMMARQGESIFWDSHTQRAKGMDKFGLPDVVVEKFPSVFLYRMGSLVWLACQAMSEGKTPSGGRLSLNPTHLRNRTASSQILAPSLGNRFKVIVYRG
jgi:hypothetical protein